MPPDNSRERFDPLRNYRSVNLNQGAVLLDADVNEGAAIADRWGRALASDILGRATVSQTTPDAFKITLAPDGALLIGKGRIYVDGLLAENHGAVSTDPTKLAFDDLLSERVFVDPIHYLAQPHFPNPPPLPPSGLVYLDVWERKVTHLEQPDLVESAVGVETSSRVQIVWQVRVLAEDAGDVTCNTPDPDVPGWSQLIAPSTGVLTTGTFEVAAVDDPCELPPTGGYRGLENQLYRVEIHDPGQPGAGATFKWSRDSVGSRVATALSAIELQLETLGRDDVLRFNTGDWVEIINDPREFSQLPGDIRRISVNDTTRSITFDEPLNADLLPATFPNSIFPRDSHLRVVRWDQKGLTFRTDSSGTPVAVQDLEAPGSQGVIAVPAATTTLLLEQGVTVSFDSLGDKGFNAGDYWVFAARTADASVELLDRVPPRGMHHHFARLAVMNAANGTVTDCRQHWPPATVGHDCGCSACVTADSHRSGHFTIQDAVNQVQQTGGTVCLGPGEFPITDPVRLVNARSVSIHGQGAATVIVGLIGIVGTGGVFALENCVAVAIENLAIVSAGRAPAINLSTAVGVSLRGLIIRCIGDTGANVAGIALQGVIAGATISGNVISSPAGVLANDPTLTASTGVNNSPSFLLTAALAVEDNVFACQNQGLMLAGNVLHLLGTRIVGNEFLDCRDVAIGALGLGLPGSSIAITRNDLNVAGDGIRCSVDGAWIDDNKIANSGTTASKSGIAGIALVAGLNKVGIDRCQILANQVSGFSSTGIAIKLPTSNLIVKLNIIDSCGNGILSSVNASSISIENNQLRNIGGTDRSSTAAVLGIAVGFADTAIIAGNTIRAVGVNSVLSSLIAGIATIAAPHVRVSGNDVSELAPPGDFAGGLAAGILSLPPQVQFDVLHNSVQRDAATVPQAVNTGNWSALNALSNTTNNSVLRAGPYTTIALDAGRSLVLGGERPSVLTASTALTGAAVLPEPPRASVLGNVLSARGATAAVAVAAPGECLFSDNRVDLTGSWPFAVEVISDVAIVNANRVRGGQKNSMDLRGATSNTPSIVVLGNITSSPVLVQGRLLGTPWNQLNLPVTV